MRRWLENFSQIESVVLKLVLIVGAILLLLYGGLTLVGNIVLAQERNPEKGLPSVSKARYEFLIQSTGEKLFAEKYETIKNEGSYQVYAFNKGFYFQRNGKWKWVDEPFILDEKYFGEVLVRDRELP